MKNLNVRVQNSVDYFKEEYGKRTSKNDTELKTQILMYISALVECEYLTMEEALEIINYIQKED